jgi:hypothetical protein
MSDTEQGLTIAFSPVQLAAILAGESISEDTAITNRVWGTFKTLGGVLELVGAGVLCLAPEPTGTTKVGCVFMGVHGADVASTGLHELWTGRSTATLTNQGVRKGAETLGASPSTANGIALTIDVAVPALFTARLGAMRIEAIRSGRLRLLAHEAAPGTKLGGHTIARHVGQTEAQLRARLDAMTKSGLGTKAVSSFKDLGTAERAVSQALKTNAESIKTWAKLAANHGKKLALPIHDCSDVIGHGVLRESGKLAAMRKVQVVLKYQSYNGMPYYVLTAFPVP